MQTILGGLATAHLNTQLKELQLDLLGRLGPGAVALACNNIVKSLESGSLFPDFHKLCMASIQANSHISLLFENVARGEKVKIP